jgi:predicted dehydrogenase
MPITVYHYFYQFLQLPFNSKLANSKLKIGVFGAGHLGKIHIRCLLQSEEYELVGFYDPLAENAAKVAAELGVVAFAEAADLLAAVDVADIVTPTFAHFDIAKLALEQKKHVFIEKPVTKTVEEADELLALAEKHNLRVAVGHVERFNPALLAIQGESVAPRFLEGHRLATFNPRGTDVSVVLDLMIHDLDIILHLVQSKVKTVQANGVAIISPTADIANARIEFENGTVANLTASRISMKQMRKIRLFQSDAYISLDFLDKKAEIVRLYNETQANEMNKDMLMPLTTYNETKYIGMTMPEPPAVNAILTELDEFAKAIRAEKAPIVSLQHGRDALALALEIDKYCMASIL